MSVDWLDLWMRYRAIILMGVTLGLILVLLRAWGDYTLWRLRQDRRRADLTRSQGCALLESDGETPRQPPKE